MLTVSPGVADFAGALRLSASMFSAIAEHNTALEHIGVWAPGTAAVTGRGGPEQVLVLGVSQGTLETLVVQPLRGRWLRIRPGPGVARHDHARLRPSTLENLLRLPLVSSLG